MPDDVLVKVSKVTEKGQVQTPARDEGEAGPATRDQDDSVRHRGRSGAEKGGAVLRRESLRGLLKRLRGIFSKVPIRDIEE